MEGVILFADDDIYSEDSSFERDLYNALCKKDKYPIVGVSNLDLAESAIRSLSSLKAFIIDYEFLEKDTELQSMGISPKAVKAKELLINPELAIFSLIYLYSKKNIENSEDGEILKKKYNERIRFREKSSDSNQIDKEIDSIIQDIELWEKDHQNYEVPFKWNQSINQAVQKIFITLEGADPYWITELYKTSLTDGVEPSVEVINLFQYLLSENIIQDEELRRIIKVYAEGGKTLSKPEDYARLIKILYYGSTKCSYPIMTGDIFKFSEDQFGIVISPECDIRHIIDKKEQSYFELLRFSINDYKKHSFKLNASIKAAPIIKKAEEYKLCPFTKNQKIELSQELNKQIDAAETKLQIEAFTQTDHRIHLLPCFEFNKNDYHNVALIDFRFGLELKPAISLIKENRIGKLNTPYIQELRQRYLAYKGRVGVPRFSEELRKWLLEEK